MFNYDQIVLTYVKLISRSLSYKIISQLFFFAEIIDALLIFYNWFYTLFVFKKFY